MGIIAATMLRIRHRPTALNCVKSPRDKAASVRPLVIGNVMYVHGPFPNAVFALDLDNDGKILWKFEPKQDPNVIPVMCCDTVNRGVAYGDGKIFLHQADSKLVALDDKTGKVVW